MSGILYKECVVFSRQQAETPKGLAKTEGVQIEFDALPALPGMPDNVAELYYAPQVRVYEIRESAHGRREMYAPEIQALQAWLSKIAAALAPLVSGGK